MMCGMMTSFHNKMVHAVFHAVWLTWLTGWLEQQWHSPSVTGQFSSWVLLVNTVMQMDHCDLSPHTSNNTILTQETQGKELEFSFVVWWRCTSTVLNAAPSPTMTSLQYTSVLSLLRSHTAANLYNYIIVAGGGSRVCFKACGLAAAQTVRAACKWV